MPAGKNDNTAKTTMVEMKFLFMVKYFYWLNKQVCTYMQHASQHVPGRKNQERKTVSGSGWMKRSSDKSFA
jgi:hypothetical protein